MAAQDTLEKPIEELESVVIRLAGDSGDGMQLTGGQFTRTATLFGNDISTLPDFPAEIVPRLVPPRSQLVPAQFQQPRYLHSR